ncbi:MAG: carboxylate-amine ligase [Lysobacter sp.]|nr:carboxylate-amine ligase [Lysobacter sp.]
MAHRYTFGIEEEFFLTDPLSREIADHPPQALFFACQAEFGDAVSHELLRSQIEVVSPVLENTEQAISWVAHSRARMSAVTAEHGLALLAAGTHPMAQWREQHASEKPRYERLMDDFQIVARRNLLCGLHVHVAPPPEKDRIRIMNQVMPWLPLLLALSASSPFWARKRTGLMSYRQAIYDEWPRTGIPDFFENERGYRAFVELMIEAGSLENESYLWWVVRPSMRYPTLELRIADACPRALDALCIAALFRAMVRSAAEDSDMSAARNDMTRLLIEENRWRAKRFGIHASFLHQKSRRNLAVGEWLNMAEERFGSAAAEADDGWAFAHARAILVEGGSADRQLNRYAQRRASGASRTAALRAVVDDLLRETAEVPGLPSAATAQRITAAVA